ncbi:hypothetical protein Vadar_009832 [Vaccinium darrowii]|uniref:Uncharacterized protein n=1 Tax=Vaccinium darrowii TaxID=229202 RepID=A0ACB7YUR0_9ERIC|nr:hypothetical protein Vadar_009832 [Vaccinium darrowii]
MLPTMPVFKKLRCRRPNSPNPMDFEIIPERDVDKRFYEIQCSSAVGSTTYYSVEKMNEKEHYFLNLQPFDCTLDEWLLDQKDIWCPIYQQWGQYRPTDSVRHVVRGLITAVCALHDEKRFHGGLGNLENYGLKFFKTYAGEEEREGVKVILMHRSSGINTNLASDLSDQSYVEREIQKDMLQLRSVIFDRILKVEGLAIEPDLLDLREEMRKESVPPQTPEHRRGIIASHTSLWHWKAKSHFFMKLWSLYERADPGLCGDVQNAMQNVLCAYNWQTHVPVDGPFRKALLKGSKVASYKNSPIDLLNFVRDVIFHINDQDKFGNRIYIDKVEGYSDQYIEKIIGDTFPGLLKDVYRELYRRRIMAEL